MSETPREHGFSRQLLAAQRVDDALRHNYEKELYMLLEKKLTPVTRTAHAIALVVSAAMAVTFAVVAIIAPRQFPWEARAGFVLGALFAGAWVVLMFRTLRRGAINLRVDEKMQAGLGWGFVVILITLLMLVGGKLPDKITGVSMVVKGLVFLIAAAVFLIQHGINDARLRVEERMLEIQLRIAELAEELKKRP